MVISRALLAAHLLFATATITTGGIHISFTPGIVNLLQIERAFETTNTVVATKTTGPMIADQVDLTYSQDFEFSAHSLPAGWAFQNVDTGAEKIATFYFTGIDPEAPNEFYDFATPLSLSFTAVALTGVNNTAAFILGGNVSDITYFATVPLTGNFSATTVPEPISTALFPAIVSAMTGLFFRLHSKRMERGPLRDRATE